MVAIIICQFFSLFDCSNGPYYTIGSGIKKNGNQVFPIMFYCQLYHHHLYHVLPRQKNNSALTSNNDGPRLDHTNDLISLMSRKQLHLSRGLYY